MVHSLRRSLNFAIAVIGISKFTKAEIEMFKFIQIAAVTIWTSLCSSWRVTHTGNPSHPFALCLNDDDWKMRAINLSCWNHSLLSRSVPLIRSICSACVWLYNVYIKNGCRNAIEQTIVSDSMRLVYREILFTKRCRTFAFVRSKTGK